LVQYITEIVFDELALATELNPPVTNIVATMAKLANTARARYLFTPLLSLIIPPISLLLLLVIC
jgi:hypothetical protein